MTNVKVNAHKAVQRAVKSGALTRPLRCEKCDKGGRVYGHHEDYSKPLVVVWLCAPCHGERHADIRFDAHAKRVGAPPAAMTMFEYAAARKALGLSHEKLGKKIGKWRATSWKYENGYMPIPIAVGWCIKEFLRRAKVRKK